MKRMTTCAPPIFMTANFLSAEQLVTTAFIPARRRTQSPLRSAQQARDRSDRSGGQCLPYLESAPAAEARSPAR